MLPEKIVLRTRGASTSGNKYCEFVTNLFPWGRCGRWRQPGLYVYIDLDLATDHGSRLAHSEILPIDHEAAMRPHDLSPARVDRTFHFEGQVDLLGHAMDRQRPVGHQVIAFLLYRLALEGDLGK